MAGKMNIHYLKKDELAWELRAKGIEVSDMTVQEMRGSLRSLIQLNKEEKSVTYGEYTFEKKEFEEIEAKYQELKKCLEDFSGDKESSDFKRLQSRLLHLIGRVNAAPVQGDEDIVKNRGAYLAKTTALMGILDKSGRLSKKDSRVKPVQSPAPGSSVSRPDEGSEDSEDSLSEVEDDKAMPFNSTLAPVPCSHNRQVKLRDWNVKFSGTSKGLSVTNFLERIEELRIARNVSTSELYNSAVDLFEDKALVWYRSVRSRCKDWSQLRTLLEQHYLPPDYKPRLFREILDRTQGPKESIIEYLACMKGLFSKYGKMNSEEQLSIVLRNLAPFYVMQLPVVTSLEELETECQKLEIKKYRADNYRVPQNRVGSCVEPHLAYVSEDRYHPHTSYRSRTPKSGNRVAFAVTPDDNSRNSQLNCWKCLKAGHKAVDCRSREGLVCFKCRKPGFTTRTCPNCVKKAPVSEN